jgi:hypothetical protein
MGQHSKYSFEMKLAAVTKYLEGSFQRTYAVLVCTARHGKTVIPESMTADYAQTVYPKTSS